MCRRAISTSDVRLIKDHLARGIRARLSNCMLGRRALPSGALRDLVLVQPIGHQSRRHSRRTGSAILVAMMATLLMTALGAALILATSSETIIAASFRDGLEGTYAADAALERAIDDLQAAADWNLVLAGAARSAFVDGAPDGSRTLADGSTIDLAQLLNLANCGTPDSCTTADMNQATSRRPWALNNPRWLLYSYGHLAALTSGSINSPYYVAVMVADDPAENDHDPASDGAVPCGGAVPVLTGDPPAPSCNPGSGVLALRAEAFGPRGVHKIVEATIAHAGSSLLDSSERTGPGPDDPQLDHGTVPTAAIKDEPEGYNTEVVQARVRILSWREVR